MSEPTPPVDPSLRAAFDLFDTDGDGYLTADEVGRALRDLGQDPSEEDVRKIIAAVDADGDRRVDYAEFVRMIDGLSPSGGTGLTEAEELRAAFAAMDADGDGFLSRDELLAAITDTEAGLSPQDVDHIFAAADTDGDGRISFEEFAAAMG